MRVASGHADSCRSARSRCRRPKASGSRRYRSCTIPSVGEKRASRKREAGVLAALSSPSDAPVADGIGTMQPSCRLPGFLGPVPPPLWIRESDYSIGRTIAQPLDLRKIGSALPAEVAGRYERQRLSTPPATASACSQRSRHVLDDRHRHAAFKPNLAGRGRQDPCQRPTDGLLVVG